MGNLFDLDNDLLNEEKKDYKELLEKADIFCMRELFDKALEIYNSIIEEDMKNEEAYIGILKVHSQYFTKFDGEQIEKDIRIIERLFPDTVNVEYAKYCLKRKEALNKKTPTKKAEPKEVETKPAPSKKVETKVETRSRNINKYPEISEAMGVLDRDDYKTAYDMAENFLNKIDDPYAHFVLGYAAYFRGRYTTARKQFEIFFDNIDKNNPFFLITTFYLGYLYSGIKLDTNPDFDKSLKYLELVFEQKGYLQVKAYMEAVKEARKDPRYITLGTNRNYHEDEVSKYAKSLIEQGDIMGYYIAGVNDLSIPRPERARFLNTFIKSPKTNRETYFYFDALWWRSVDSNKKLPPEYETFNSATYFYGSFQNEYKSL